ncbi:MAG: hypothetical protein Q7T26_06005 [Dehalococcoidia bacterium]|nr:hypothetical protein [Dehalococcoidia bacterium]
MKRQALTLAAMLTLALIVGGFRPALVDAAPPAQAAAPRLLVPRSGLALGAVPQLAVVNGSLEIGNGGNANLVIRSLPSSLPALRVTASLPLTIGPGNRVTLPFTVDTSAAASLSGILTVESNDPQTPRADLPISGAVESPDIRAVQRAQESGAITPLADTSVMGVADKGRNAHWEFFSPRGLINYTEDWRLELSNKTNGRVEGSVTATAARGDDRVSGNARLDVPAGQSATVAVVLDVAFVPAVLGMYSYSYKLEGLSGETTSRVTMIDIMRGQTRLDTFPADSPKARTWTLRDYYSPSPVTIAVPLEGPPVGATPTLPPSAPTATPAIPPSVPTTTPVSAARPVDFQLRIAKVEETGLTSRRMTAEMTNTGDSDAHNVSVKLEVSSRGKRIAVNGKDSETIAVGTIGARQMVSRAIDISFSLADGFTIQQQGAEFLATITSTEKTSALRFTYP